MGADILPNLFGILALGFKQRDQEGVLDGCLELGDILHIAIRPDRFDALGYLAQDKGRRGRGCNGIQCRVPSSISLKQCRLAKDARKLSRGTIRLILDQLEDVNIEFCCFRALKGKHLGLEMI